MRKSLNNQAQFLSTSEYIVQSPKDTEIFVKVNYSPGNFIEQRPVHCKAWHNLQKMSTGEANPVLTGFHPDRSWQLR
jgi:hypothetical protein